MEHEKLQFRRLEFVLDSVESGKDLPPYCIEIHPTDLCNQNCQYCFNKEETVSSKHEQPPLSLTDYLNLLKEAELIGVSEVSISGGGEPFLSRDTLGILEWLVTSKMRARVVTNGSFLPEKATDAILAADEIRFSVDAAKPETYNLQRGLNTKDAFSRTLSNIRRLVESRNSQTSSLKIGATFLITSTNMDELEDFAHLMLSDIGIDKVIYKYDIYSPGVDAVNQLQRICANLSLIFGDKVEYREGVDRTRLSGACGVPYFKAAFNPYGDLYACCLGSQPGEKDGIKLGSIREAGSFGNLWQSSESIRRDLLFGGGVACNNCNVTDQAINISLRSIINSKIGNTKTRG